MSQLLAVLLTSHIFVAHALCLQIHRLSLWASKDHDYLVQGEWSKSICTAIEYLQNVQVITFTQYAFLSS